MPQPNLIFIMPDQLRPDFLGCYGADFVATPNIDRLADSGTRYTQAYSLHPLCVPARVSLLTGMHGLHTGVLDNGQFLRPDYAQQGIQLWPELLSGAGYTTAAIGKMHFYPWDLRLGFNYRAIAEDKRWLHIHDDYYHFLREHGYRKLHGNEHPGYFEHKGAVVSLLPWEYSVDHFVGQEACRFIDLYGEEGPFAMMVGFPGPHCPYDPAPESLESINPAAMPEAVPETEGDAPGLRERNVRGNLGAWNGVDYSEFTPAQKRRVRAHYAALVQQIDHEVGEILATLERRGVLENTVIIFSADHGDYLGDHNLIGKGTFFESSIHVPMIVSTPGAGEGGEVNDDLVALTDVMPTLLSFAGVDVPANVDALPLPGLGFATPAREHLIGALNGGWMIDDGEWRLCKYSGGECLLFNRREDPDEQHNRYGDPACEPVRHRLDVLLTQAVMQGMRTAHHDRRVYTTTLSQQPWFGWEGWQRPYPRPY